MRIISIFVIYLYFIFNILCLSEGVFFPKKENILILTDYTFEEAFQEYEYIFISVYSDICRTCTHKINPNLPLLYKEIINSEEELKNILVIGKIDGSYNHYFMNKYNILGYPSILLFNKGKIISQLNNRYEIEDMLMFLRKKILRPIQYINNITQYNRFIHSSFKESFITYYGSDKLDIKSLSEISNTYNHLTFLNIYNTSLIKEMNKTIGDLTINKFFDEPIIVENKIGSNWNYIQIEKFIQKYNHKILIEFNTKEGENFIKNKKSILILINKQELNKEQIKRMQYMEKINIKEVIMTDDNKINQKNFFKLAKSVRDKIQSSFIIYKKNYISDNNIKLKKKRSIFDEEDPFGFEYLKQQNIECEKRQIDFINKLDLDNNTNCEIRLVEFKKEGNIKFFKLYCGEEYIEKNIDFIQKWYEKKLDTKENEYDVVN